MIGVGAVSFSSRSGAADSESTHVTLVDVNGSRMVALVGVLASMSALVVLLGRVGPIGTFGYPTRFLVWNLILAWMPLGAAWVCWAARSRVLKTVAGVAWIAFLPNSPYLVTDLVHLGRGDLAQLWRLVLQFGVAAWTGTMLGIVSLRIMHETITKRWGVRAGWCVAMGSIAICAVGVVIGRFQRWNSWDLIAQPSAVAASTWQWISAPVTHVASTGVAVAVALYFGFAYLSVWLVESLVRSPR